MKFDILNKMGILEEVDIELPYYYEERFTREHDIQSIYGRIEENQTITIKITKPYTFPLVVYELEIETVPAKEKSCCVIVRLKSTEEEFLKAKLEFKNAISSI